MKKSKSDVFLDIVDSLSRHRRVELMDDEEIYGSGDENKPLFKY